MDMNATVEPQARGVVHSWDCAPKADATVAIIQIDISRRHSFTK
jgi:hypothetical protein